MIEFETVKIGYSRNLFSIDSLELSQGEIYTIVGANGSGKSTLLKAIKGNSKAYSGEIKFNERSLRFLTILQKSKLIASVNPFQEKIPFITVRDFVLLGRTPHLNFLGSFSNEDIEKVDELLETIGLSILSDKFLDEVSDGERQLLSIARAIIQDTEVIVLDEPTAFLDYVNRIKVVRLLKDIAIKFNKCIIFSSHELELCIKEELNLLIINKLNKKLEFKESKDTTVEEIITKSF